MSIIKLKDEFALYLLSIRQAFEAGGFAAGDNAVLESLFEQGILYAALLEHEELCNEATQQNIAEFCKLIETALPAPVITDEITLSFQLVQGAASHTAAALPGALLESAKSLYRPVVVNLMSIFQMAVFDLSYRLKNTPALSSADVENAHYVIGMAEITVRNFEAVIAQDGNLADSNYDPIRKFFVDGTRFAAALQNAGASVTA